MREPKERRDRRGFVEIAILGPLQLRVDGRDRPVPPPAARRLLVYLAMEGDMRSRDTLTSLLWPGIAKDRSRPRLSQALHGLKSALGRHGQHILRVEGDAVGLHAHHYGLDARAFRELATSGCKEDRGRALNLLRGTPRGYNDRDNVRWQSWFSRQIDTLAALVADLFHTALNEARERGELSQAQDLARQWIGFSPYDELAHLALMETLCESGLENAALAHADLFSRRLAEERGRRPGEALRAFRARHTQTAAPVTHHSPIAEEPSPTFHKGAVAVLACHLHKAGEDTETLVVRHYPLVAEIARLFGGLSLLNPNGSMEVRFHDQVDGARRAAECALRIRSRLSPDVLIDLGIHCGTALVTHDASPQIMGGVSRAAHDLAFRSTGGILVSQPARDAAATLFRYAPADDPEMTGLAAFRLVEPRAAPSAHAPPRTFGREIEERVLRAAWARVARSGRGTLIHMHGEPGIGKTHLLRHFVRDLPADTLIRYYHCAPEHQRSVLGPIAEVVRDILGGHGDLLTYPELSAQLGARGICDAWLVDVWAAWLGIPVSDPVIETRTATADFKEALYESVLEVLANGLNEVARVIIVDDVQWADPSSMELLALFITKMVRLPCLVVLASRGRGALPTPAGLIPIDLPLKPLSVVAAAQLVLDIAPEMPVGVRRSIVERAAGTPLFLRTIAHLAQSANDAQTPIPDNLQEILVGRIYALGAAAGLAQAASILGQSFPSEHLARLWASPEDHFTRACGVLKDAGILVCDDDGQTRFAHALYFEAARTTLAREQARVWHHKAALLLSQDARWSAAHPERLAEHFTHGGDLGEGLIYWRLAARRAATLLAPQTALLHLTTALAAIEASIDAEAFWRHELAIRCDFAATGWGVEGFTSERIRANLTRLLALCERYDVTGPPRYLVLRAAWLDAFGFGDMRAAERAADTLAEAAWECEEPRFGVAAGRFAQGVSLLWQGRIEASAAALEDGVRECRREFHALSRKLLGEDVAVSLRAYRAISRLAQGRMEQSLGEIDELEREAEDSGVHATIAYVLTIHGALAFFKRDLGRAERVVARLEEVCAEASLTLWATVASIYRAWIRAEAGDWTEDAARHLATALLGIEAMWRSGLAFCATIQCAALLAAGDPGFPEAMRHARDLVDTTGAFFMLPDLLLQEGLWHRRLRDPRTRSTALTLMREAEIRAREQGNHLFAGRARAAAADPRRTRR
ncbi:hypothetical protein C4901_15620 [Acidiferrobacter sp. SPIII_3]|uniref:AAA family ATPase n=1 Tax=Acidiferrobacter sp. SPIII_3 TaxID=1281578 RepID=UPI000D73873C|nr:AAA family ATPase [Acidiferrobacter sp. SPIII_3]AWP24577.1 hypothetical protein C4901_15620 [Acidiferrobacter sp. SPIII_3]